MSTLLEKTFFKALRASFSQKRLLLAAAFSIFTSLLFSVCLFVGKALGGWFKIGFFFFPFFLAFALLLCASTLLMKLRLYEFKQKKVALIEVIQEMIPTFLLTSYVSMPLLFAFCVLWVLMGVFFLFTKLPLIGSLLSLVFSFVPLLLMLATMLLTLGAAFLLFLLPPIFLISPKANIIEMFSSIQKVVFQKPLAIAVHFFVAILPFLTLFGLFFISSYFIYGGVELALPFYGLHLLFLSIPVSLVLTAGFVFFLNFSLESYFSFRLANPV